MSEGGTRAAGAARWPAVLADAARAGDKRRVSAPGGMGKTRLLTMVADQLGDKGVVRWNAAIDPRPPDVTGGIVLADNVHDADADAVRALARSPVGAVIAHRPCDGDLAHVLDALDGSPCILEPLGPNELCALLAITADERPPNEIVGALRAYTGGIPRLVLMSRSGDPDAPFGVTWALEQAIRSELRRLSPPAVALLAVSAVLEGIDVSLLVESCGLDLAAAAAAAGELVAAGLASDTSGRLVPAAADATLRAVPRAQQREFVDRAARVVLDGGGDVRAIADRIRTLGIGGPDAVRCLISAAGAVAAGSRDGSLIEAVRSCDVTGPDRSAVDALIGFHRRDAHATVAAADRLLAQTQGRPLSELGREAITAAAVVLARRGAWAQCAEMAATFGSDGPAGVDLAVLGRVAVGHVDAARQALAAREHEPPRGIDATARLTTARGMMASVTDDPSEALPQLLEAARLRELAGHVGVEVGGPHALAALLACHLCEFEIAAGLITEARHSRHYVGQRTRDVLSGWLAMHRGDLRTALARAERVRAQAADDPRFVLAALAIVSGVTRRRGDLDAMLEAWRDARTLLLTVAPELPLIQPIGELLIAGARLGDRATVRSCLAPVQQLLARASHPPLWTLWARWNELHIAIALDDLAGAKSAAKAAAALPWFGARSGAIAEAAVSWADALTGNPDPARVRTAARALADVGLVWEAARLAGGVAIRTPDSVQMRSLLQFARELSARSTPELQGDASGLSPREREVAGHLIAGLTHREIGAQLFIAPKTVEHHVARIRRRLGVRTRSEMLLALRRYVRPAAA